jgi:hypothetical protein
MTHQMEIGMSVTGLYDVAEKIDQLISEADGFNWRASQILIMFEELADRLREEADELIERNAKENEHA